MNVTRRQSQTINNSDVFGARALEQLSTGIDVYGNSTSGTSTNLNLLNTSFGNIPAQNTSIAIGSNLNINVTSGQKDNLTQPQTTTNATANSSNTQNSSVSITTTDSSKAVGPVALNLSSEKVLNKKIGTQPHLNLNQHFSNDSNSLSTIALPAISQNEQILSKGNVTINTVDGNKKGDLHAKSSTYNSTGTPPTASVTKGVSATNLAPITGTTSPSSSYTLPTPAVSASGSGGGSGGGTGGGLGGGGLGSGGGSGPTGGPLGGRPMRGGLGGGVIRPTTPGPILATPEKKTPKKYIYTIKNAISDNASIAVVSLGAAFLAGVAVGSLLFVGIVLAYGAFHIGLNYYQLKKVHEPEVNKSRDVAADKALADSQNRRIDVEGQILDLDAKIAALTPGDPLIARYNTQRIALINRYNASI